MYFRVLGPVELNDRDGTIVEISAEKQRRLLAALLLRANTWVSIDYLVEAVWPNRPPKSTVGNVKTYIHYLRGLVPPAGGEPRIDSRRGAYRLRAERHECDATVFEDQVSAATETLARAQPVAAVEQLTAALGLWRGDPYGPLTGAEVQAEAERLSALMWHTRYTLTKALLAAGRAGDAITLLCPLTAEDPLREKTWEHLLRAMSEDGRWAEVLVAFQKVRQVLADELGVVPGPELRRLHQLALRANEPRREPHDDPIESANQAETADVNDVNAIDAADAAAADRVIRRPARFPLLPATWPWQRTKAVPRRRKVGGPRKRNWALLVLIVVSAWLMPKTVTSMNLSPQPTDTGAPALTFLSPSPGQVVQGVVTLRVKVSDTSRLRKVDFHQLTSRCPQGGDKQYIGMDTTPTTTGVYQISFDTRQASNGCLDFGAVGLDRADNEFLHPAEGTCVPITVNN